MPPKAELFISVFHFLYMYKNRKYHVNYFLPLSLTLTQDDEEDSDDRSALAYLCTMLYLVMHS